MFFRKTVDSHDFPQAAARSFQNLRQIAQDAVGLRGDVSSQ